MDIPVIARMSDLVTLASLSAGNPSLNLFELPPHRFWKWGALLLALIYAFSSVARMVKIFVLQLHGRVAAKLSSSSEPLFVCDDEVVSSDDEAGDDVDSSCSSEDEEEMRNDSASTSYENLSGLYEDFRVKGSGMGRKRKFKIRRKRSLTGRSMLSLADLVNGESVVKFWDGLGLEFQLDGSSPSISILDLEKNMKIGSLPGQIPAVPVSPSSPTVVFTANAIGDRSVGLRLWDVRLRRRMPAVQAEWSGAGAVVRVKTGGVHKVYVRDDASGNSKVWDVRNARSPLENVTECSAETRWDANAVRHTEKE